MEVSYTTPKTHSACELTSEVLKICANTLFNSRMTTLCPEEPPVMVSMAFLISA